MANHHLLEALAQRDPEKAEQVFSGESAFCPPESPAALAPVKRVAIFAEAFLPKVDGVSKTAYLTLRYLQQTGREVLVFAPDIAPSSVSGSQVIALPSLGIPAAPETPPRPTASGGRPPPQRLPARPDPPVQPGAALRQRDAGRAAESRPGDRQLPDRPARLHAALRHPLPEHRRPRSGCATSTTAAT